MIPRPISNAPLWRAQALSLVLAPLVLSVGYAQEDEDEEVFELSPFEVTSSGDEGYRATHTLAGTRINTELKDVGSAITVVTKEFLRDIDATDTASLLTFTPGTEVSGINGNMAGAGSGGILNEGFQNPSNSTRVRGLDSADNTTNLFLTSIPWDSYNVDRVDLQRGPNSILFGLGNPSGIINTTKNVAAYEDESVITLRLGDEGSNRLVADINRVLIEDELAVRVSILDESTKYAQKPAFENDTRLYATFKYEPSFLNSEDSTTTLSAFYEHGDIDANRPRAVTPVDGVSRWFAAEGSYYGGLDKQTFDMREGPEQNDLLRNWPQSYGGTHVFYDPVSGGVVGGISTIPHKKGGIGPDGLEDGSIDGLSDLLQPLGMGGVGNTAGSLGLPNANLGLYKEFHMQDSTIFDYWNNLLDGDTKWEKQSWNHFNVEFSQTFMNDRPLRLGYSFAYDDQAYSESRTQQSAGNRTAINIDLNEVLPNGSPNPHLGRPYMTGTGQWTAGGNTINREQARLMAYAEFDFMKTGESDSFLNKVLGRHVLSGVASEDNQSNLPVAWHAQGTTAAWGADIGFDKITDNDRQINTTLYLGPSLLDRNTAAGANIPGIQAPIGFQKNVDILWFDNTWNSNVDPSADWYNPVDEAMSTQSENPANYVGWTERSLRTLNGVRPEDRAQLYRQAESNFVDVESEALVLQSFLLEGAIVGTYGWREDTASAANILGFPDANGVVDPFSLADPRELPEDQITTINSQNHSYSVALHVNELPLLKELPLNVSLYYNESSNFSPLAGRTDYFNQPLPLPAGTTRDRAILLSTKDNKYSLKVTRYNSSVTNSNAKGWIPGDWYLGQFVTRGTNAANKVEFRGLEYDVRDGMTQDQENALANEAVQNWRQFESDLRDLGEELAGDPHAFYKGWGLPPDFAWDPQVDMPNLFKNGFVRPTQDQVSEGYEYEFTAQPTKSLRLSFNASQVEAIRNNIGGTALNKYVEIVDAYVARDNANGGLRMWGGGVGQANNSMAKSWNRIFRGKFAQEQLTEGSSSPELREWRFNMVANYSFRDGALKGWNVGVGHRWQDDVIIGYGVVQDALGFDALDIENPYVGPSQSNTDLWIGHRRDLGDKVKWKVQLNVRNAFSDKELIPISTQPNGDWAGVRMAPQTSWNLTNTFTF